MPASRTDPSSPAAGTDRSTPTFKETFVAVGQEQLDRNRSRRADVVSVGIPVTVLVVLGGVAYTWLPWATVAALVLAVLLLGARGVLARQTARGIAEMQAALQQHQQSGNTEYLRLARLRGEQMLRENKALTAHGRRRIQHLLPAGD